MDVGDEAEERGRTGKGKRKDDEGGWFGDAGGVDDSGTCLECTSQQPWGLMMEVIGTQICKGGWL